MKPERTKRLTISKFLNRYRPAKQERSDKIRSLYRKTKQKFKACPSIKTENDADSYNGYRTSL